MCVDPESEYQCDTDVSGDAVVVVQVLTGWWFSQKCWCPATTGHQEIWEVSQQFNYGNIGTNWVTGNEHHPNTACEHTGIQAITWSWQTSQAMTSRMSMGALGAGVLERMIEILWCGFTLREIQGYGSMRDMYPWWVIDSSNIPRLKIDVRNCEF